jgi:hypothetical protein
LNVNRIVKESCVTSGNRELLETVEQITACLGSACDVEGVPIYIDDGIFGRVLSGAI